MAAPKEGVMRSNRVGGAKFFNILVDLSHHSVNSNVTFV